LKISRINAGSIVFWLAVVGLWEILHRRGFMLGRWPSAVAVASMLLDKSFLEAFSLALYRSLSTVAIAIAIGVASGVGVGFLLAATMERVGALYHAVNGLRSIPVTVLIPVFLGVFGLQGFLLPMIIVPVASAMAVNSTQSIRMSRTQRRRLLELRGFDYWSYATHALTWELASAMIATLRIVVPFAFSLEIALDYFTNANQGVGYLVYNKYALPNMEDAMFASIILIGAVGVSLIWILDKCSERILAWQRDT